MTRPRSSFTPPGMGCYSIAGLPPIIKFTELIYTPGWRGTVREKCLPFLREQLFDYGASRGVKKTRASSVIAFNKVIFKLFFQLLC